MTQKAKKVALENTAKAVRVQKRLLNAAGKTPDIVLIQYDTSYDGYDREKVEDMRDEHGSNAITRQKRDSVFTRLREAFVNPFTIVLFVLAVISFVTEDWPAAIIVLSMVTISGLLRFVQEFRSGKAAERLTEMVETTVAVQR
ncbi:MAG: cation-transporting P-type ATPase, partial [Clostridia bacterium]|nr:cation-transporting P-type ATPase [Clostridia bacterium]